MPARLGTPFRWLLASSWMSNIADGLQVAAGPLLVASETRDPFLVSLAAVLQYLPFLLFGLFAGVIADRVDRRRLVAVADLCRVVVIAVLVGTVVTDEVNIAVVLAAMFLLGVGETFADTTTSTLLPMIVPKANLGVANARLITGIVTFNQLAGPPVGALLFGLGRALPFVTQGTCMVLSVLLVLRVRLPVHGRDPSSGEPPSIRKDIVEGLRWVMAHAAIRTLTLTIVTFNVTFGAAWSVLVLYSLERLGMGEIGFGLLTSALACGGLAGTLSFGWLERHVSLGNIMRVGLIIETLTHLVLAVNTVAGRGAGGVLRVRRARVHLGHDLGDHPPARRTDPDAGPRGQPLHDRRHRRHGARVRPRRPDREPLGHHRALLVRLRRVGAVPGPDLAPAGARGARRRGDRRAGPQPRHRVIRGERPRLPEMSGTAG